MSIIRSFAQFAFALSLFFVLCGGAVVRAFNGPIANPPLRTAVRPINTSTQPQVKPFANTGSSGPTYNPAPGALLTIEGITSANFLYAWEDMVTTQDLTVKSLLSGQTDWNDEELRPVCLYEDPVNPANPENHKLAICTPQCGNGFVEQGEACDDGNNIGSDQCSNTCQINEVPPPPPPSSGPGAPNNCHFVFTAQYAGFRWITFSLAKWTGTGYQYAPYNIGSQKLASFQYNVKNDPCAPNATGSAGTCDPDNPGNPYSGWGPDESGGVVMTGNSPITKEFIGVYGHTNFRFASAVTVHTSTYQSSGTYLVIPQECTNGY